MNLILKFYRRVMSPISHLIGRLLFGSNYACRFSPTCSQYFSQAIEKYGIIHGGFLGTKRILKCHPFSNTDHFDPLP